MCHPTDHIYMYAGSGEHIDFHVKNIAQAKVSTKPMPSRCNAVKRKQTMDEDQKAYILIGN